MWVQLKHADQFIHAVDSIGEKVQFNSMCAAVSVDVKRDFVPPLDLFLRAGKANNDEQLRLFCTLVGEISLPRDEIFNALWSGVKLEGKQIQLQMTK